MSSNENDMPIIDIAFVSTDEVLAWKRPIRLRFKGNNEVQISLYWDEQDGYSAIVIKFFDEWSDDKQTEFNKWLMEQKNLHALDELTAFTYSQEDENE